MAEAGLAARRVALAMLDAVLDEGRSLAELGGADGPLAKLTEPSERARARRLAVETLRHLGLADRILKPHLRRAPPVRVRNALRLATVEMLEGGAAAHGAVHAAVTLMNEGLRTAHAAGLVNAVLRKVSEAGAEWEKLPCQELPGWLRGRLLSAYGAKIVAAIERAHAAGAVLDMTPKDGNAAALAERLQGLVLPTGSVRLAADRQVTGLPGFAEGDWWVQDAAAALAARGLGAQSGERIADLCAAPGGKTLQLAAAGAEVTAVDISPERMVRVAENLKRTGLTAQMVVADVLTWAPEALFDAVLLDAPCSATGTIRRHPDLPFIRASSDIKPLVQLQSALLDRALALVKPGGRVLFATCSLLPEEGEGQIKAALARHLGLSVDAGALDLPGVEPAWRTAEGGLRLRPDYWPELGGMDGFYLALLRRA